MARALVANAGDEQQVRKAARSEKWLAQRRANDWRTIVGSPEGRRVLWSLLEQCKVFESIMETSARIYYNAGRQDFGHLIIAEITTADPLAWLLMQREAGEYTIDAEPTTPTEDPAS